MLDHPRRQPAPLHLELLAVLVARAHPHFGRALHVDVHEGNAQASLARDLRLLTRPLQDRVDERRQRILGVGAIDEHAVQHADLRGRQPDPERVLHQLAHALDLSAQRLVEAVDRERARAQHRVAELAHVAQRRVAARAGLGIELLDRPALQLLRSSAPRPARTRPAPAAPLSRPSRLSLLRVDVHAEAHARVLPARPPHAARPPPPRARRDGARRPSRPAPGARARAGETAIGGTEHARIGARRQRPQALAQRAAPPHGPRPGRRRRRRP